MATAGRRDAWDRNNVLMADVKNSPLFVYLTLQDLEVTCYRTDDCLFYAQDGCPSKSRSASEVSACVPPAIQIFVAYTSTIEAMRSRCEIDDFLALFVARAVGG